MSSHKKIKKIAQLQKNSLSNSRVAASRVAECGEDYQLKSVPAKTNSALLTMSTVLLRWQLPNYQHADFKWFAKQSKATIIAVVATTRFKLESEISEVPLAALAAFFDGTEAVIFGMATAQSITKSGFGLLLLRECQRVFECPVRCVSDPGAVGFYQKAGFEQVPAEVGDSDGCSMRHSGSVPIQVAVKVKKQVFQGLVDQIAATYSSLVFCLSVINRLDSRKKPTDEEKQLRDYVASWMEYCGPGPANKAKEQLVTDLEADGLTNLINQL